jgi:hypothetical protein
VQRLLQLLRWQHSACGEVCEATLEAARGGLRAGEGSLVRCGRYMAASRLCQGGEHVARAGKKECLHRTGETDTCFER